MSKADEMFKDLGYYMYDSGNLLLYKLKEDGGMTYIEFFRADKTFAKTEFYHESGDITMQELQAINEKCRELGWI